MTSISSEVNVAFGEGKDTNVFDAESGSGADVLFQVFAKDPGVWNDNVGIRITDIDAVTFTFNIDVYYTDADGNTAKVESWLVSRKQQKDGFGTQQYLEDRINERSNYIVVADDINLADTVMPQAQATTLFTDGGSDGSAVTVGQSIIGWDAFTNPETYDVRILIGGGYTDKAIQIAIQAIAENRRDCMAILDPDYDELTSAQAIVEWRNDTDTHGINSSYTALYAGWVEIYDKYNDIPRLIIPPSGYIAATYAENDFVNQVWDAPAGLGLQLNVLGVTNDFTPSTLINPSGERDVLYAAQVNPIVKLAGRGIFILGDKTEQAILSDLSYVPTRRLLIVLEKSLAAFLQGYLFKRNNATTRFLIEKKVDEYLSGLSREGAFYAETPDDKGYLVVCDETNNPTEVVQNRQLNIDIFIKPIGAVEYIQLQTVVTSLGTSFTELINRGLYL